MTEAGQIWRGSQAASERTYTHLDACCVDLEV